MISFGKPSREELLKTYQRIIKSNGRISLSKILFMRIRIYIGLGFLFIAGFAALAINVKNPVIGASMVGLATGSFVTDVCFMAAIQRALPVIAKIINPDSVNQLLDEEYASKKRKKGVKK